MDSTWFISLIFFLGLYIGSVIERRRTEKIVKEFFNLYKSEELLKAKAIDVNQE